MRHVQKIVSLFLVYAFFGLALAASAAEPNLVNPALIAGMAAPRAGAASADQPAQPSGGRRWTHGGKIMTFIGVGLVGAGAFMMTRSNTTVATSGSTAYQINWKATGGITMGAGAVLMILGLTRRR
jgi:hypothetical protein